MGRYDADFGTVLVNKGNGNFICENINGLQIIRTSKAYKEIYY
jgi:enediyne biosynthesis protein E4